MRQKLTPPPPRGLRVEIRRRVGTTLAAAALAATVMGSGQSLAQGIPTIEFADVFGLTDCRGGTCPEEMMVCPSNINVGVEGGRPPGPSTGLTVRVLALTRSGHDRLRDYGVPVYLDEMDTRTIRSSTTRIIPANSSSYLPAQATDPICWRNDHLDTGDSEVEVVIVGGAGYRVNPAKNSIIFTITEDDDCANPGNRTVYVPIGGNMNNTCVCRTRAVAAELYPGSVQQADGTDWDHSIDDYYVTINGNRSLRSSNDSSNYCPESPYQGPGT